MRPRPCPVVTKTTQAWIGNNSVVDADGALAVTAPTGGFDETVIDTRFRPSAAVSGNVITLPYAHGFTDGQKVVYYAGGDDPIPGLEDGGVYYVDLSGLGPNQLRLVRKLKPIGLGLPGTGAGQTLTASGGTCTFNGASGVSGDTITCTAAHGLSTDDAVVFDRNGGTAPTGLEQGKTYYAIVVSPTTLKLALSPQDTTASTYSLSGSQPVRKTHRIVGTDAAKSPSTPAPTFDPGLDVNTTTDAITIGYEPDGGAFAVGDEVRYYTGGGAAMGGLKEGTLYIVWFASGNVIKLAEYDDDAPQKIGAHVDITTIGTGSDHSVVRSNQQPPPDQIALTGIRTVAPSSASFRGVSVTAAGRDSIATIGVSGGVGGSFAVNIGGAVTIATVHTNAWIGDHTHVNQTTTPNAGQSVRVAASSDFSQLGIAGAISIGGTGGIAPAADVRVVLLDTSAAIGADAQVRAANDIEVLATATDSIISVSAGLAGGGTVGVGGAVAVIVLTPTTSASIGARTTAFAGGDVHVLASDDTSIVMAALGIGIGGTVGVGASVGVMTTSKIDHREHR